MRFISESPESRYSIISYNGLNIFLDTNDFSNESIQKAQSFCALHNYATKRANAVYFLRGTTKQVDYDKILVGILEAETLPIQLNEIVHCLTFWNQEGEDCFQINGKDGQTYAEFILKCILSDCQVFVEPYSELFITGRGGDHVWVSHKDCDQRIMIIHF